MFLTPTILQMETVECGAASLGMVLAYHGLWIPLEQLREDTNVSRDGSSEELIRKAATVHNLDSNLYKIDNRQLLLELKGPAILWWNRNHFVVYEGERGGRIRLNDPAVGRRLVSGDEFDRSFSGYAIGLTPTAAFVKGGSKPSTVAALKRRFQGGWSGLSLAVLAGILLVIPGFLSASFSTLFVNYILTEGFSSWVIPLAIGMVVAWVLQLSFTWLQLRTLVRFQFRLTLTETMGFLEHLLRLPTSYYQQRFPGDLNSRLQSNATVASLLSGQLGSSAIGVVSSVLYAGFMALYSWQLTLLVVLVALGNAVSLQLFNRARSDESKRLQQSNGRQMGVLVSGFSQMMNLKASGREGDWVSNWAGIQATTANFMQSLGVQTRYLSATSTFFQYLVVNVVVLGFGAYQVISGELTVGGLSALQLLANLLLTPITTLVSLGQQMQTVSADLARLDDVLATDIAPRFAGEFTAPGSHRSEPADGQLRRASKRKCIGHVEFKGVTFGYSRAKDPLLKNLDLSIRAGGRVALVGASGSGKSTIGNLLVGLYDPWEGEVLIDGVPVQQFGHADLTTNVSRVDQSITLFEGTIAENITMFGLHESREMITGAAMDAGLGPTIKRRQAGIDAVVTPGGGNFSAGERQQIEIARSLSKDPSILVLDEATSSLDSLTELEIDSKIRARGCTCLIIAHRLSTVRDADEIIVLDRGTIAERGTHAQLMANNGPYASLVRA